MARRRNKTDPPGSPGNGSESSTCDPEAMISDHLVARVGFRQLPLVWLVADTLDARSWTCSRKAYGISGCWGSARSCRLHQTLLVELSVISCRP